MKLEIESILEVFEGDLACLGFFSYLCTAYNSINRRSLSMRRLSAETGFSLQKVKKYLSRLEKKSLIELKIRRCSGVEVFIDRDKLIPFETSSTKLVHNRTSLHDRMHTPKEPLRGQVYTWLT
jgi:hypothetical protein